MNIFLIRHGDAESYRPGLNDADRRLTPDGEEQILAAAAGWKVLVNQFDCMVSSPLIRARQTAQLTKEVFQFPGEILVERFVVGGRCLELMDYANRLKARNIVFFGHEPDFSEYLSEMISNSGSQIDFKKGMIAKVSFSGKARQGAGMLEFLIPAKTFWRKKNG